MQFLNLSKDLEAAIKRNYDLNLSTFAGLPATMALSGTSFTTTDPAPITTLFPIVICPIITTLGPIFTLSPIVGRKSILPSSLVPMVVLFLNVRFLPIDIAPITVANEPTKQQT